MGFYCSPKKVLFYFKEKLEASICCAINCLCVSLEQFSIGVPAANIFIFLISFYLVTNTM